MWSYVTDSRSQRASEHNVRESILFLVYPDESSKKYSFGGIKHESNAWKLFSSGALNEMIHQMKGSEILNKTSQQVV